MKITVYRKRQQAFQVWRVIDIPFGCHDAGSGGITNNSNELQEFFKWWNIRNPDRTVDIKALFAETPIVTRSAAKNEKINTPKGQFDSLKAAAFGNGITVPTLYNYFKSKPTQYYRGQKMINRATPESLKGNYKPKRVMTPKGEFPTIRAAHKAYDITVDKFRRLLRDKPDEYFIIQESTSTSK